MSEKKDNGGPAYPATVYNLSGDGAEQISDHVWRTPGMSLRDWLAGTIELTPDQLERIRQMPANSQDDMESAMRYAKADAMLEARKR